MTWARGFSSTLRRVLLKNCTESATCSSSMKWTIGWKVFPSQIEELIVGQLHLAPHYSLEVRREGPLDHLEVMVELDPLTANVAPLRDEAARDLQRRIKSYVGVTASVTVCSPGTIDRSIGKAKRVFDQRGESLPPAADV